MCNDVSKEVAYTRKIMLMSYAISMLYVLLHFGDKPPSLLRCEVKDDRENTNKVWL